MQRAALPIVLSVASSVQTQLKSSCKLQFKLKFKKNGNSAKKLNVNSLRRENVKAKFQAVLLQKLIMSSCNDDPTPATLCENLASTILKTSADVLGCTKKKNMDWFDEDDKQILDMLTDKRVAHHGHRAQSACPAKKATLKCDCSTLQRKLRETHNEWWDLQALRTKLCTYLG